MDTIRDTPAESWADSFQHARPKKLRQVLAEYLEERVVTGSLAPGAILPSERELSRQFGVSRTVVRDAIRTLATKGLLDVQHGVGAIVTSSARPALLDSLRLTLRRGTFGSEEMREVRDILDDSIAAVAAQRATAEDTAELAMILQRYAEWAAGKPAEDADRILREFQLTLVRATHNRMLMALFDPISEFLSATTRPQRSRRQAVQDYERYREVYIRIRDRDADGARAAMHSAAIQ